MYYSLHKACLIWPCADIAYVPYVAWFMSPKNAITQQCVYMDTAHLNIIRMPTSTVHASHGVRKQWSTSFII